MQGKCHALRPVFPAHPFRIDNKNLFKDGKVRAAVDDEENRDVWLFYEEMPCDDQRFRLGKVPGK